MSYGTSAQQLLQEVQKKHGMKPKLAYTVVQTYAERLAQIAVVRVRYPRLRVRSGAGLYYVCCKNES